jgi:predicted ATPase/transcriptional regulator with XRE-family HTH domain
VAEEALIMARTQVFGDLLRVHRQAAGLSQEELAERARLSTRAVGDLERGTKLRPHRTTIQLLAAALNLSAEQLSEFEAAARRPPSTAPSAPSSVPSVAAPQAAPRHNLPAALTSFIGRTHELAEVTRCLATQRLVTLTGAGGVGKTRLATEIGIHLVQGSDASVFADGVWLVELAELAQAALVAQALVRVFKLPGQIGQTPLELLQEYLADKHLLLVLDNCEHLVEACAEVVEYLLHHCWGLHVLATSREELRIPGETIYPVRPLTLPDPLEDNPEQLLASAAAQLFVARSGAGHLTQQSYREDAAMIAHICRQLDGIPLALELAAPLTHSLSLSEIAAQLHNQMAVLTSTYRTTIPRHQTMHSALVWSYQLLTPAEQQLLDRIAVFAGGWTLEAAQAVCADTPAAQLLRSLQQLVAQSLVLIENLGGRRRYRLLEPVRQFARTQLAVSGEQDSLCRRHAAYFLALAEQMGEARDTPREREWLQTLEAERANLRAVNSWAIEQGEIAFAHRFNGLLFAFWIYRSSASEARHWMDAVLELKAAVPTPATLTAEALALDAAAYIAVLQHDFAQAQIWFERELTIHTAMNDQPGIATVLRGYGFTAMLSGDLVQAQHYTGQSLILSRAVLDRWGEAWSLFDLGYLALVRDAIPQARGFLEEALPQLREQGNLWGTYRALLALGHTMRLLDDAGRARGCYRDALCIQQQMHYLPSVSDGLEGLAGMAASEGDPLRAVRLFGAAQAHRDAIAAPRWRDRDASYARDVALARSLLDEEAWRAAWAAGGAMPLDQAVAYALAESSADDSGSVAGC